MKLFEIIHIIGALENDYLTDETIISNIQQNEVVHLYPVVEWIQDADIGNSLVLYSIILTRIE